MSVTVEESNFLRFYFLNLKVASKAVRVYFDSKYSPVRLAGELKNNETHLKSLKFLKSPQRSILFPSSGQYGTSGKFDTTLMICLLRNMYPYPVVHPQNTGWDDFPQATDTSRLADLARVKWYRNFVSHHEKGELTVKDFDNYCGDLEQAIARLGGQPMLKQAQSAQHIVLDTSLIDILNLSRKHEKDIHDLSTLQEENTSKINELQTRIENQKTVTEQQNNRIQKIESKSSKHSTDIAEIKTIETWQRTIKEHEEKKKVIQEEVVEIHQQFVDKLDKKFKKIDDKMVEHDEKFVETNDLISTLFTEIDNMKNTHFHAETIRPRTIYSVETMNVLIEVSKSVGYISGTKQSGTCWRVGNDKIITAAHVIRANIRNSRSKIHLQQDLKNVKVDFNYIQEKSSIFFKVEPRVLFIDDSLDVAVLQLQPYDQQQLPPPLKMFARLDSQQDEDKHIHLISHNKGFKKEINSGIGIWNLTDKRIEELKDVCKRYGHPDGYKELDRKDRLIIRCDFVGGASGSPGIVIYNNEALVVFVYIRGFPSFYYRQEIPEEKRKAFPKDKLLQQGVNIGCLFDTMTKNGDLKLRNEIFPVENQHQLTITSDKTSINTNKAKKRKLTE